MQKLNSPLTITTDDRGQSRLRASNCRLAAFIQSYLKDNNSTTFFVDLVSTTTCMASLAKFLLQFWFLLILAPVGLNCQQRSNLSSSLQATDQEVTALGIQSYRPALSGRYEIEAATSRLPDRRHLSEEQTSTKTLRSGTSKSEQKTIQTHHNSSDQPSGSNQFLKTPMGRVKREGITAPDRYANTIREVNSRNQGGGKEATLDGPKDCLDAYLACSTAVSFCPRDIDIFNQTCGNWQDGNSLLSCHRHKRGPCRAAIRTLNEGSAGLLHCTCHGSRDRLQHELQLCNLLWQNLNRHPCLSETSSSSTEESVERVNEVDTAMARGEFISGLTGSGRTENIGESSRDKGEMVTTVLPGSPSHYSLQPDKMEDGIEGWSQEVVADNDNQSDAELNRRASKGPGGWGA
ncbi:unnamed protein product, partial [Protopolystoma xenopodis]